MPLLTNNVSPLFATLIAVVIDLNFCCFPTIIVLAKMLLVRMKNIIKKDNRFSFFKIEVLNIM